LAYLELLSQKIIQVMTVEPLLPKAPILLPGDYDMRQAHQSAASSRAKSEILKGQQILREYLLNP